MSVDSGNVISYQGFNRDPHFQRVMLGDWWGYKSPTAHRFNRDPHFQRVMLA